MNIGSTPEEKREFRGTTWESIICSAGFVIGTAGAFLMIKHLASSAFILIGITLLVFGIRSNLRKGLEGRWRKVDVTFHAVFLVLTILSGGLALVCRDIERKKLVARQQEDRRHEYAGQISCLKYPGWYGFAEVGETALVIASFADESPLAKLLSSNRTVNVSIAQVVVVNRSAKDAVLVDATKAVLMLADGRVLQCVHPVEVLGSYTKSADKMISRYLGPHSLRPKSEALSVFIHLPFGFSWSDVTSVTVYIDGKPVMIQGRVLTVTDKMELVEARIKASGNTVLSK